MLITNSPSIGEKLLNLITSCQYEIQMIFAHSSLCNFQWMLREENSVIQINVNFRSFNLLTFTNVSLRLSLVACVLNQFEALMSCHAAALVFAFWFLLFCELLLTIMYSLAIQPDSVFYSFMTYLLLSLTLFQLTIQTILSLHIFCNFFLLLSSQLWNFFNSSSSLIGLELCIKF